MRLSRFFRRVSHAALHPTGTLDYKAARNQAALADARDAILTGSTTESFEATGEADAAMVRRHAPPRAVVLNIGCGIGRVEKYLAPQVAEMWAVDVSGEMIAGARKRLAGFPN